MKNAWALPPLLVYPARANAAAPAGQARAAPAPPQHFKTMSYDDRRSDTLFQAYAARRNALQRQRASAAAGEAREVQRLRNMREGAAQTQRPAVRTTARSRTLAPVARAGLAQRQPRTMSFHDIERCCCMRFPAVAAALRKK